MAALAFLQYSFLTFFTGSIFPVNNPLLSKSLRSSLFILEGGDDLWVKILVVGRCWYSFSGWSLALWEFEFVAKSSLGGGKGCVILNNFVINTEVWNEVVSLWWVGRLTLSKLVPLNTEVTGGLLTEFKS